MTIAGRDRAVVAAVARFGQLSSYQVRALLFDDVTATPCDRALRRLTEQRYLARIERRMVGGSKGGSGQYVYQLGSRGYYLHFEGSYRPQRTVNYHSLAIADCYLHMVRLERAGLLEVLGYSTEPDCHVEIGGEQLKPDLYAHLARAGRQRHIWLEIDMASQGQRVIRDKLARYWRAYQRAAVAVWPGVVFVAVDDERAKELAWLIGQLEPDAQSLFTVCTGAGFPSLLVPVDN